MAHQCNSVLIMGGAKRGKSTLGRKLSSELRLKHVCTDPQRLCPPGLQGTPDHLRYSGAGGVGEWVAREWLGRDGYLVEGVKVVDALKRCLSGGQPSSWVCSRLIVLTERVDNADIAGAMLGLDIAAYRKQEQQATHTMAVLEELETQLDNLEHWYPTGPGQFARSSF